MPGTTSLPTCDQPGCLGHLGKFGSCLSEALWQSAMDDADATTGDTDFEGHYALLLVKQPLEETLDVTSESEQPLVVTIPAGSYISHTATSGAVSLWTYDSPELAQAEFDAAQARYYDWDDFDGGSE